MIEILFGWLTKPQYSISFIDELFGFLEVVIFLCIIGLVYYLILTIKVRRNKK